MTDEDKKRIAEYMGWGELTETIRIIGSFDAVATRPFDLNDASLCAAEMQKRGDWEYFVGDIEDTLIYTRYHKEHHSYKSFLVAWLFNAENFFTAMAEWLKEVKK